MFQPETEDMLPRAAPKPSAEQANAMLQAKPAVPEVSLLFAKQQSAGATAPATTTAQFEPATTTTATTTQSYAAWKKQVLPRVTYFCESPHQNNNKHISPARSSIYPLRPAITNLTNSVNNNDNIMGTSNGGVYMHTHCNDMKYRRFMDTDVQPMAYSTNYTNSAVPQQQQQKCSMDSLPRQQNNYRSKENNVEVLTICAGTQTDTSNSAIDNGGQVNLVTQTEFQQVVNLLQAMRSEQQRVVQMFETLLQAQITKSCATSDVGTQCEILALNNANTVRRGVNIVHDRIIEESTQNSPTTTEAPQQNNNFYNQLRDMTQFQSPRMTKPAAQSTTYRPNTPKTNRQQEEAANVANAINVLPKPTTEKSMVMNELALKYLPNDKLNELLHELHISQTNTQKAVQIMESPHTPLRQIDNYGKGPNDMSNASYKYLKKYRLLPEEHSDAGNSGDAGGEIFQHFQPNANNENMPSPYLARKQQQTPLNQHRLSPLVVRQKDAPLERAREPNVIDLEHIRNKPKFF